MQRTGRGIIKHTWCLELGRQGCIYNVEEREILFFHILKYYFFYNFIENQFNMLLNGVKSKEKLEKNNERN